MLNDNLPSKAETIKALYDRDIREFVRSRKQGGQDIPYLEWFTVNRLLDELTGGNWDGYVAHRELVGDRMVVTYRIVVHCADGDIVREATGGEEEDMKGYGDFMSNAEAMAFKRAAARLGLGLSLYAKDSDARRPQAQPAQRPPVQPPPARAATVPPAGTNGDTKARPKLDALLAKYDAAKVKAMLVGTHADLWNRAGPLGIAIEDGEEMRARDWTLNDLFDRCEELDKALKSRQVPA